MVMFLSPRFTATSTSFEKKKLNQWKVWQLVKGVTCWVYCKKNGCSVLWCNRLCISYRSMLSLWWDVSHGNKVYWREPVSSHLQWWKEQLFSEHISFGIQVWKDRDIADFQFQMVQIGTWMILQYWTINGKCYQVLRTIALKVFSIVNSSAASEWTFSMNGLMHSKLWNLLKEGSSETTIHKIRCPFLAMDWEGSEFNADDYESVSSNYKSSSSLPNIIELSCYLYGNLW